MATGNILSIKALALIYGLPFRAYGRVEEIKKRRHCCIENNARLYMQSRINNKNGKDSIKIGAGSQLLCRLETYAHGGRITIGDFCFIGENTYIWSMSEVIIGSRVLISHDVNIHDTNSHSLSAGERHEHFLSIFRPDKRFVPKNIVTCPVIIEDDVWIGFGATVLKGVKIGKGAVVAARSIVTKDVSPYTVVAGHPAREIGTASP